MIMRFFVISRIIKGEAIVIEALIILDFTKNRIQQLFYYTLKVSIKIQNKNKGHGTSERF